MNSGVQPTLPAPLTVAAAQVSAVPGDIETNARAGAELVHRAAELGARVLVLPELYLCGYDMATIGERPGDCDLDVERLDTEHIEDERIAPLHEAAAESGVVTLAGASVRRGSGRTISLLAFDDDVRVVYDKQHVCGDEAEHFEAGGARSILTVDGWPLGLAVCYDGCFPEHARAAADEDALAYIAAVAYVAGSAHRRELYYRARAVENGMYVVVSGLAGRCGDGVYDGGTAIYEPEGRPVESVDSDTYGMALATLDASVIERTRAEHTMHADHRASLGPLRRY